MEKPARGHRHRRKSADWHEDRASRAHLARQSWWGGPGDHEAGQGCRPMAL